MPRTSRRPRAPAVNTNVHEWQQRGGGRAGRKKNEAQHWLCTLTGIVQDYTPVEKEVPQPADAFYCAERGERVLGSGGA